jgi:ribosome biogenesis protein Nip4
VVLNKAQNFDEELIGLLLEDSDLKEKFFIQVKDIWVFKQNLYSVSGAEKLSERQLHSIQKQSRINN